MQGAWEREKTIKTNFRSMGLSSDPNKTIAIPSSKQQRVKLLKNTTLSEDPIEMIHSELGQKKKKVNKSKKKAPKAFVVDQLEENATAPRESGFMYSKDQTALIEHYLDKYELNYKAMVMDRKNYDQETWRQLRSKIRRFLDIPEHVEKYLKKRGLENLSLEENSDDDSD